MTERGPRMSGATLKVLRHLLLSGQASGADINRATRVQTGTLYPVLHRLEAHGWVVSEWEALDPREAGRPRRRYYELTPLGRTRGQAEIEALQVPPVEGDGPLAPLGRAVLSILGFGPARAAA